MTSEKRKERADPPQPPDPKPKKPRQTDPPRPNPSLLEPHEAIIAELKTKYNVLPASVISSTQIRQRVAAATGHLLSGANPVVLLHARPAEVCKLITIAEQSKRVLKEEGRPCFQYNQLFDLPPETKKPDIVEKTVLETDAHDSDDDDDFEVMETRFEKAVFPQTVRTMKSMRVFLSTMAIPEIKAKSNVTVQTSEVKVKKHGQGGG
ncbi:hypothetical protein ACRE_075900 [Hapsidospora chrysogenum ATCC 11550]|uniref:DNA/RNA-binding protein Alba-like domain-containing protein n=1 Tax=Hapsidospora chrysogenum (strain ATCC 11550 / CBS 779.69 / DSM 880 / IAM 14645 / JCM 23072 / IMI 49137) TaxID=857340 RepID=A0A086SX60_HAPC1|nr:hypothetical protein ACRE_075900 [Hapsidospora chrysogenum ATCC 11550]